MADLKLQFGKSGAALEWQGALSIASAQMRKAMLAAAKALAEEAAKRVRQGYTEASFPRTSFTGEVYAQGKSEGAWPTRTPHAGSSMNRTAGLARFVRVRPLGNSGYQVEIDQQATYSPPSGEPADWGGPSYSKMPRPVHAATVAQQLENPVPIMLRVTQRMLGYLQSLKRGTAGKPTGTRSPLSGDETGMIIVVRPSARPVWHNMKENISSAADVAFAAFDAALGRR